MCKPSDTNQAPIKQATSANDYTQNYDSLESALNDFLQRDRVLAHEEKNNKKNKTDLAGVKNRRQELKRSCDQFLNSMFNTVADFARRDLEMREEQKRRKAFVNFLCTKSDIKKPNV